MISLSTNVRTVEMISSCTSVRPAVWARRAMSLSSSSSGSGLGRGPLVGALHPRGAPLARDHQGHLAGGLVDHLVAEHRGAALAAGLRGEPLVRVEDVLGVVVVLLRRAEDLVGGVDLAGVQHPLAVEAEGRGAAGDPAEPVDVLD